MNDMLHIVLGGSGGVGRAVVTHLSERGKRVRAINRSGQIADLADGVEVRAADALNRESVVNVCADAGVIYHCVHPKRSNTSRCCL